jgi:hypothetical protein
MNVKIICFRVERIFKRAEITSDVIFENLFPLEVSKRLFQLRQTAVERRRVLRRQSKKTQPPFISLHRFGYFRLRLVAEPRRSLCRAIGTERFFTAEGRIGAERVLSAG